MQSKYRKRIRISDRELRFRAPKEILRDLEKVADRNGRSRNAEILHRLAKTLEIELCGEDME